MSPPKTRRTTATALLVVLLAAPVLPAGAIDGQPDYLAYLQACPGGQTNTSVPHATGCLESLYITDGNAVAAFTVGVPVRRWAMAHALINAAWAAGVMLPEPQGQGFQDIDRLATGTQRKINQLAELGITRGKTADAFDPGGIVTRQQMAVFFTRLLALAATGPGGRSVSDVIPDYTLFTDIGGLSTQAQQAIRVIYELGVTTGTTATKFSPTDPVTGGQMALFLIRLLAHTTARGEGGVTHISNTPNRLAYSATWCYEPYFSSPEFCEDSITISNSDGSNEVQLTNHGGYSPILSPSGHHIVYHVGGWDVGPTTWVIESGGSVPRRFASTTNYKWSPSGKYIAYEQDDDDSRRAVWIADADVTNPRKIASRTPYWNRFFWSPSGKYLAYEDAPRYKDEVWLFNADTAVSSRLASQGSVGGWSPDEKQFAYSINGDNSAENGIYISGADGSNPIRLTRDDGRRPMWSLDGKYLFYYLPNNDSWYDGETWIVSIDGSTSNRIGKRVYGFQWSPDGEFLGYTDWSEDTPWLVIANANGTNPRRLIENGVFEEWSPDGQYIGYIVRPVDSERHEVWIANADGSNRRRLSEDGQFAGWSTDGTFLFYSVHTESGTEMWEANADGTNPRMSS